MEKLKIIFLDFDGVISTPDYHWSLEPSKVQLLEELIKETNAKIVVSSSWSTGSQTGEQFIEKMFGKWKEITGPHVTPEKNKIFKDAIIDVTDHMGNDRGDEIQRWLDAHKDEVDSYVIFDDDPDILDEQLFNFVQTDGFEGLTSREIKLAKLILNKQKVAQPVRLNWVLMIKWYDRNAGRASNIDELLTSYHNNFKN